jgi:outer membrane immunogenic protein
MRRILLGIAVAALFTAPTLAADYPLPAPVARGPIMMPPAIDWNACYLGGNIGWGRDAHHYTSAGGLSEGRTNADGVVAGGQVGCDLQVTSYLVIGAQGLMDWADANGSNASSVTPANVFHTSARWFATAAGRLGIAVVPALLVYGKGGFGWVGEHNTFTTSGVLTNNDSNNRILAGIDAGGGFEWKMNPNWSLWVEYDRIFRRTDTVVFSGIGGASSFQEIVRRDFEKVLFGINYRFGGPVVARY